jgi:PAS domain S-box-containing protein
MYDRRSDPVVPAPPDEAALAAPDSGSHPLPLRLDEEPTRIGAFRTPGAGRSAALLRITAAIADAVSDTEVFAALVDQVAETLEASSAGLWIVDDGVAGARLVRSRGYPEAARRYLAVLPLEGSPSPALDAIRTGEPLWFASQTALYARYPHLASFAAGPRSYRVVCLPLLANRRTLGVLALTIEEAGEASDEEREFLLLVARYASQALERLRLLEAERRSRAEAALESSRLYEETLAAQARAERSLAQLEAIVNSMTEGLLVASVDGKLLMYNSAALAIHGYRDIDEVRRHIRVYRDVYVLHDLDGRELPVEEWPLERARRGDVFSGMEVRVLRKDTGREWMASYGGAPVRDRDRSILWTILTVRDITEQKRDEAALRRREQAFRTLAENIPAMVARFDRALRHVYVNRHVELATGTPAAGFVGKTNRELGVPDELCAAGDARLRHVFDTGTPIVMEFTLPSAAGPRICQAWFGPEFGPDGVVETALCITRDVTEQKELENELRRRMLELAEAARRKDDFLATLAHELRNPLAPIRNAVQVLKLKAPSDPKLTRSFDVIDRQVTHMARLLEDLLDVSRISRDKLELRREAVAIHEVLEAAIETSRPMLDAGRHELRVHAPQEPIWVNGDPVRLAQIFSNLLNNAAKYTPSGGKIVVSVESEPNAVSVSVEDNGIGIEPDVLPSVFDIFTQAGAALGRSQGGIGIGLSLVKGLVALHGGTVRAMSEGTNRGSTFVVTLPTLRLAGFETGTPNVVTPLERGYRVLVVDDNVDSAETIASLLEILGSEVKTAFDGAASLSLAEAFAPEVVLLDVGMPGMDGLEVCRRLRREPWGRDAFVVAMTGWGSEEDRRRTRDAGFDAHLVKPIDSAALMKLLAERLRPA